jgi:hypothetical protein
MNRFSKFKKGEIGGANEIIETTAGDPRGLSRTVAPGDQGVKQFGGCSVVSISGAVKIARAEHGRTSSDYCRSAQDSSGPTYH